MKKNLIIFFFFLFTINMSAQTYTDWINKAMDYVEKEDFVSAEAAFKEALRKEPGNPGNAMLMVNLGTIQRQLGELDEAMISYNVAIEKYPKTAFLRHNRAALYCEMNRFDDAMKDYNSILLLDDKDVEAHYRRALLYINEKNLFAAEEDLQKIIVIDPDNLPAKAGLAMIMKRRGEWEQAEKLYTDLIYKNKTNADLYFNRAECYLQLKKLARTQEDIAKASELGYTDPLIYVLRGQLRLAQYDKRLAKEDFLKARELGVDEAIIKDFLVLCK